MNSTIQASDSALLARVGHVVIADFIQSSGCTLFYGVFAIIYTQAVVTYLKTPGSSPVRRWMLLICTITFLLATAREVAFLGLLGTTVQAILIDHQDLSLTGRRLVAVGLLKQQGLIPVWSGNLTLIISDSIVIWRAFILLQRRRWMIALPLLTLLGTIASFAALLGLLATGANMHGSTQSAKLVSKLGAAELSLSLATNVITTAFIGYVFWLHRRDMMKGLRTHRPTQGERILAMLVESGVVFCIPQTVYFLLGLFPAFETAGSAGLYAQLSFEAMHFGFAAMYPTVVIALVNSHHTFDQMYMTTASLTTMQSYADPDRITTLKFATSATSATSDSETSVVPGQ